MFIALFVPLIFFALVLIFKKCYGLKNGYVAELFWYAVFTLLAYAAVMLSSVIEAGVGRIAHTSQDTSLVYHLLHAALAAFTEEPIKFIFLLIGSLLIKKAPLTDAVNHSNNTVIKQVRYNVLLNCAFVFALLFATFENIAYFLDGTASLILRLFTATILHCGLIFFTVRSINKQKKWLLAAIGLHFAYNACTYYPILFFVAGFVILVVCVKNILNFFIPPTSVF